MITIDKFIIVAGYAGIRGKTGEAVGGTGEAVRLLWVEVGGSKAEGVMRDGGGGCGGDNEEIVGQWGEG